MTRHACLALLALLSAQAPAAMVTYRVDPSHTFPSYEIRHLGLSIQRGRFNATSGEVSLDREARKGSVDIVIDASSISTGNSELEQRLRGPDFFDSDLYPKITFKSTELGFTGDKLASVKGELTLHGVTRPVTLKVSEFRCDIHPTLKREACGAEASATLRRSEFGIRYGVPAVSDEVKLLLNIEAIRQ